MIEDVVLGLATLVAGKTGNEFYEETVHIPAGVSEISTDMTWNAMTLFSVDGEPLPEISYANDRGEFVLWRQGEDSGAFLDLLFAEGNGVQNKLQIKVDEPIDVTAHFFDTHIPGETFVAFDPFDKDGVQSPILGLAPDLEIKKPRYISRAEWGADESLRVWDHSPRSFAANLMGFKKWFEKEADEVPKIYRPKTIKERNEKGEPLFWPVAESPKIAKFVVHHTGEYVKSKRHPKEIMRAIYYYHTKTRGWGDIGYNYVIDKHGNIYEGRAGGARAVGAHTMNHNIGTIGVSLMGNFQREKPTDVQLKVLSLLLADHTRRFDVDSLGRGMYLGTNSFNISGHRHVARKGHGTACPGKNLVSELPDIRKATWEIARMLKRQEKQSSTLGRDFTSNTKHQRYKEVPKSTNLPPASFSKLVAKKRISRGQKAWLQVEVRNGTKFAWPKRSKILVKNIPEGVLITPFRAVKEIKPGKKGTFRARVLPKKAPNGIYALELDPVFLKGKIFDEAYHKLGLDYPLHISGDRSVFAQKVRPQNLTASVIKRTEPRRGKNIVKKAQKAEGFGPNVKIKLAFFDEKYAALVSKSSSVDVLGPKDELLGRVRSGIEIRAVPVANDRQSSLVITAGNQEWKTQYATFRTNGIIEITNYDRGLGKTPYNTFRNKISIHPLGVQKLLVINELPIELYLRGLAEEPSTEPEAKKHAIHILARSYALVYSGVRRKFHTALYDLEDDPRSSQFYLGYDWERYHTDQIELLKHTFGQVLTYSGKAVIGPYFTQSGGESSAKWRRQYPWTKAQKLPFDEGLDPRGHGVGLSGNSARELAKMGKNHKEILNYFFTRTKVEKKY